jgi:hypothetical protein
VTKPLPFTESRVRRAIAGLPWAAGDPGFVYRGLKDHPDAVDRFFMAGHRHHPRRLN